MIAGKIKSEIAEEKRDFVEQNLHYPPILKTTTELRKYRKRYTILRIH